MKSKIAGFFRKSKLLSDLWALLLLALGVFLLMYPETAVQVVCRLIGLGLLLYGLVLICSFLIVGTKNSYGNPNIFRVFFGVLLLVMGLFVSLKPNTIVEFAGIVFAVLLFAWSINGFLEMKNLVELRDSRWWIALLSSLVTVILGCVVMFAPISSSALLMRVAGFGLVYTAVTGLFLNFRVVRYVFKYERTYGPLIEDVTGKRVDHLGPPKDTPPVIDGEVRVVEDEEGPEDGKKGKKKKEKHGFRRKKKEASEAAPAQDKEKDKDEASGGSEEDSTADSYAADSPGLEPDAEEKAAQDAAADENTEEP